MKSKKIAFWHRYGPAGHTATCHSIPYIIQKLNEAGIEVHYFGMKSTAPVPALIRAHCTVHCLPVCMNRSSTTGKLAGTLFWYAALPWIALRCRLMKINAVFWDETLPLGAFISLIFYGKNLSITVADFFTVIYSEQHPAFRKLSDLLLKIDYWSWRKLPLIFTKVPYTKTFLEKQGIPPDIICCAYNPCDTSLYSPGDKYAARRKFGLNETDFIIVHPGYSIRIKETTGLSVH